MLYECRDPPRRIGGNGQIKAVNKRAMVDVRRFVQ
jgi:hypothetical protein